MPQTEEHLDIVHLLGVKMAIFIITKADLVQSARIAEVEEEIKILTLGTALEDSAIIAVSSVTGQGLMELKDRIAETLKNCDKPAPPGYFRLPVDRAFVLQGHGVVVTGTALSGQIKTGDHVRCLPGDQLFRVRSLQVHGRPVDSAGWGQRVALNLTGPERADITRGHVICHEKLRLTSDRFDTHLEVRPAAGRGIKNHQRVRLHLGTAERLAKVILLSEKGKVQAKESAYCQITVSEPLLVLRGDHFIVRDETAQRTLAGGMVINPWVVRHKKGESNLQDRLQTLHHGSLTDLIEAFLEESSSFAVSAEAIYQFLNVKEDEIGGLVERIPSVRAIDAEGEKAYSTQKKSVKLREAILKALKDFHASHPLVAGMDMEELRGKLPYDLSAKMFRAVVDTLTNEKVIGKEGSLLRLAEHRIQLGGQEKSLMDKIKKILADQPMAPPDLKEIEKQLGISRNKLSEVIRLMERDGSIVRVTTDLYFLATCVQRVKNLLQEHLAVNGEITAAGFRDLLGSSRKYTIALLEYFDREGTTLRIGDIRRLKSAPAAGKHGMAR
jgi:selenocysteine-specific elongation factor